jgi:serine protease inhibitor
MDALRLANSAFAVDLFKQLCEKEPEGNILFSPICLSTALSLAQVGAKGDTASEIGQVTYPSPPSSFDFEWGFSYWNHRRVYGKMWTSWSELRSIESSANL